jgi:hypothetical protein
VAFIVISAYPCDLMRVGLVDSKGEEVTCLFRRKEGRIQLNGETDIVRVYLNMAFRVYQEAVETVNSDDYYHVLPREY